MSNKFVIIKMCLCVSQYQKWHDPEDQKEYNIKEKKPTSQGQDCPL